MCTVYADIMLLSYYGFPIHLARDREYKESILCVPAGTWILNCFACV